MARTIRLLDLGLVPPVRSQTVYHAVAHTFDAETPDTIILVAPSAPYVCIGYHQELEKEVDTAFCAEAGLSVFRREVGGGAVYLDHNQLFSQWVFRRSALPAELEARFELYIRPLVETYRRLGIEAYLRPINDVQVAGRKIGGTGAMASGEAEVLVGSLMFDFNSELMARVLKVSSEKMRDKVFQSLQEYMTTMRRELGEAPEREAVTAIYLERCAEALGAEIVPGGLSEREEAMARELDVRFAGDEWLGQKGGLRWLSVWGLVAICMHLATVFFTLFTRIDPMAPTLLVLDLPIFLQEMVMAVWLIVKGFSVSASTSESGTSGYGRRAVAGHADH